MDMDPFDEFEMKPLTEGLGFHKKAVKLKETVKQAKLLDEEISSGLPESVPHDLLEETSGKEASTKNILLDVMKATGGKDVDVEISEILPRTSTKATPSFELPEIELPNYEPIDDANSDFDESEAIKSPQINNHFDESVRRGAADSYERPLRAVPFSISSSFVDALTVLAFAMLFLVSLVLATGVDLFHVIQNARGDLAVQISMGVLYVAVYQMYVVVARSFFGKTLGEWTFDLQLGDDKQIKKVFYPVQVLWRSFVVLVTGVVLLPVLSIISRRDVTSYLTGLQLYKK